MFGLIIWILTLAWKTTILDCPYSLKLLLLDLSPVCVRDKLCR